MGWITECDECGGHGFCDPCQGYGVMADSYPNAGDGEECDICCGDGVCAQCQGSGEVDDYPDHNENDETDWAADDAAAEEARA